MFLQNPTYLFGLFGLLVPLAVHLFNQGPVKRVKVGSLLFFENSKTKQIKSVRLNEIVLLLLRSLIVVFMVLALCRPSFVKRTVAGSMAVIVEADLLDNEQVNSYVKANNIEDVHILQDGFPIFNGNFENLDTAPSVDNFWSLVDQFPTIPADSIVIFTKGKRSNFKGKRPKANRNVNWLVVGSPEKKEQPIAAFDQNDSIHITTLFSNTFHTYREVEKISRNDERILGRTEDSLLLKGQGSNGRVPLFKKPRLQIMYAVDSVFLKEGTYFKAAFRAIAAYAEQELQLVPYNKGNKSKNVDLVIWFRNDAIPKTDAPMVVYKSDIFSAELIKKGPKKNQYELTQRLDINTIKDGRLADRLLEILNLNANVLEAYELHDFRGFPEQEIQAERSFDKVMESKRETKDITHWFWMFLLPVFLVERMVSKIRRQ